MKKYFKHILLIVLFINNFLILRSQTIIKLRKTHGIYTLPCKVNGIPLELIFDTGASDVSLSFEEASKMIKLGLIDKSDFLGSKYYQDASGNLTEGFRVNIRVLEIDKIILKNVEATILKTNNAPLLLGQSALKKIGQIIFNPQESTLTILNANLINESNTYDLFKNLINNNSGRIDNFCGFKLLQYEYCIANQLGEPDLIKKINSTEKYVVYSYGPKGSETNLIIKLQALGLSSGEKQIVSIQLTGKKSKYSIRGITLGTPISEIRNVFPITDSLLYTTTNSFGDGLLTMFDDYNLSIEENDGVVTSLKIFYQDVDDQTQINDQISNFKLLKNAIKYFNSKELINLFAPDFEIRIGKDQPIRSNKGFEEDIISNKKIINFINDPIKGLKFLLDSKIKTEYSLRIDDNVGILQVLKFRNSPYIHEIVLRAIMDKFLIWEIH